MPLKDATLAELSLAQNVAQFVSFGPGDRPTVRHSSLRGQVSLEPGTSPEKAIQCLLDASATGTVNVRSFLPSQPNGNPFFYGLSDVSSALGIVQEAAILGYYTIVNETIDVDDGGVSGVYQGGVVEFSSGATPRAVENAGAVAFPVATGLALLERIYGFPISLGDVTDQRVEFSVHPLRVGTREQHVVVWEASEADPTDFRPETIWPNTFSRLLGDKVFGLLVADAFGFRVPLTKVFPRSVAPFSFGTESGTGEVWLRTAPRDRSPGKFTTTRGWTDPFRLLSEEDPTGSQIASVLAQDGIEALYSGAAIPRASSGPLIEGVPGYGDDFMLGTKLPEALPINITRDVADVWRRLTEKLGDVSLEWVHDGRDVWVIQLHKYAVSTDDNEIVKGEPRNGWLTYQAGSGIEALRILISQASADEMGIEVLGRVGLTSHVGDLLRRAGVPAKQVHKEQAFA